jgi:hypothetical protein
MLAYGFDASWVHKVAVPPVQAILPNRDTFSHMGLATRVEWDLRHLELAQELRVEANGMASDWE